MEHRFRMPYKIVGQNVYHRKGGKWKIKQRCKSPEAAKRALRLLNAVEHGYKPRGEPGKALVK